MRQQQGVQHPLDLITLKYEIFQAADNKQQKCRGQDP